MIEPLGAMQPAAFDWLPVPVLASPSRFALQVAAPLADLRMAMAGVAQALGALGRGLAGYALQRAGAPAAGCGQPHAASLATRPARAPAAAP